MKSFTLITPKRPHLALTMGDPAGIGPEIILKALADPTLTETWDLTVIGTRSRLLQTYQKLSKMGLTLADPDTFSILDIPLDPSTQAQIIPGQGNGASGEASFAYLDTAIAHTLKGEFQGIVTAPIAKSCWKAAGYNYPGQTEVLADRAGVNKFGMLFVGRSPYTGWILRTLLVTTHIPLNQVAQTLTPNLMSLKLDLLINCLQEDFALKNPKIVIAGLNPHSGENGQLGTEEKDWLLSWLETEQKQRPNLQLIGLVPPDTMWVNPAKAWYGNFSKDEQKIDKLSTESSLIVNNSADAYLALYHDQGLIPVKLMAFEQAINTTIGLPFIRTSPDHGTAFDIAGKGIAKATSLKEAIKLGAELTQQRLTKIRCKHSAISRQPSA
ncbi:4-hydroxythreonine-4-phosphate dehydrogenase PdxA [Crocosphaera sp. UHCC 0190]|uniref:4-hydroxythreonine-4-phosphate dehydrogenase PdxA n=1 Tax=Crocosphaera sp. UHCC 0190 TaxID=3110246 RepID=UPI002B1EC81A|nr:4-hydroxythreonine-4-phosphate dehydrogenase PdxA [Crocosphaera sp. UHCC 0190]MEA5509604.1 4-hydroxythreonine-4-phosphate dehydrogenase PdxA [Crocosphaera sp. UHCC 0190]